MSRRLMLLNVILLGVVAFGGIRIRHDMQSFSAEHRVDRIQPDSDKASPKPISPAATTAKQDWPDIAAHDPFSFDRNDVAVVITPPAAQQPKRPKPLLFGTISLGKEIVAMLGPGDSPTRSSRPVHSGEIFDGWTVEEIQDKTVNVKWDDVKETLVMNDPTALRVYDKTGSSAAAPGAVTSFAPTGPSAAPPVIAPPGVLAPQTTTAPPNGGKQTACSYTPFGQVCGPSK